MDQNRLNFSEFTQLFLIFTAVETGGDFDRRGDIADIGKRVPGIFPQSWIKEGWRTLLSEGYILNDSSFFDRSDSVVLKITPKGLEEADSCSRRHDIALWEEIRLRWAVDESFELTGNRLKSAQISEKDFYFDGPTIIDPLSEAYIHLNGELRRTISEIRSQNELIAEPEGAQKLAELVAGGHLLDAPQADTSLIERLLVQPLKWFGEKIRDEGVKYLIQSVLSKIAGILMG